MIHRKPRRDPDSSSGDDIGYYRPVQPFRSTDAYAKPYSLVSWAWAKFYKGSWNHEKDEKLPPDVLAFYREPLMVIIGAVGR